MENLDTHNFTEKFLFVPLSAKYYDAFIAGTKDTEYRLAGPRWNLKTCYPERPVLLSRGYGKQRRATAQIEEVAIIRVSALPDDVYSSMITIYGERIVRLDSNIIAIKMKNIKEHKPRESV